MSDDFVSGEVVEDARTGEVIVKGSNEIVPRSGVLMQIDVRQIGTLEVDQKAIDVLSQELNPNDVQIRPDGLLYLPWTWYNKRLNDAFGLFQWGLIPQGAPQFTDQGNTVLVVWLNWLVVKGHPVSMAGGETSYQPSNYTMSKGDAIEGARSNSLARNCKNLGMAMELWDKEWVEAWKKQFAETYKGKNDKTLWRKKGSKVVTTPPVAATTPAPATPAAQISTQPAETPETSPSTPETATEPSYKPSEMRTHPEFIVKVMEQSGAENVPTVMRAINKLDKQTAYTLAQVVKSMKPSQEK